MEFQEAAYHSSFYNGGGVHGCTKEAIWLRQLLAQMKVSTNAEV